uniref:Uncharacterized protein n=1 Tax=Arundo donax TaxID=35708 RepID=A0A0A9FQL0_ARUDO
MTRHPRQLLLWAHTQRCSLATEQHTEI